jgi:hypothetical protein
MVFNGIFQNDTIVECCRKMPLEQVKAYTIDLANTDGSGRFKCPKCRVKISPDDKTDSVYTVLETVMKGDSVERIILLCNKCGSQIHLVGFQILNETQ